MEMEKEKRFSASPREYGSAAVNPLKMMLSSPNEDRDVQHSPRLNSSMDRMSNGSKDRRQSVRSDNLSMSGDEEIVVSRRGSQNGGVQEQEERNSVTPKRAREVEEDEDDEIEVSRPAKVILIRFLLPKT